MEINEQSIKFYENRHGTTKRQSKRGMVFNLAEEHFLQWTLPHTKGEPGKVNTFNVLSLHFIQNRT